MGWKFYTVANHYILSQQQEEILKKPLTIEHFQPILETVSAHMRPIDVGRVPRVEPLGRRVSGHRDRDLPVLETLADLDRDDPKLAFQAARPVGLFRRLWASCELPRKPDEIAAHQDEAGNRPAVCSI
jgi:hypothetical protein